MNVLVCVKRVPATGAVINLTADELEIDTRNLGFAVSPHEECAVEEAVRLVEQHGGTSTVLTLGPEAAVEQLRDALAMGIDRAILLQTGGAEWDPQAVARAITRAVEDQREQGHTFDLILFGNESADSGGYQVGIRVAHALGLPCLSGIKRLAVQDGVAKAQRETDGGREVYELSLPAVFTIKEGINLPRYPSLPGRLKAKKKPVDQLAPARKSGGLEKVRLMKPAEVESEVEILGQGPEAAPKVIEILQELRLL
jgi:electron transfer flavoprotein beta subunit